MAETLSHRLKTARKAKGMTQKKLAKASGVPAVCISNYERGLSDPAMFTAMCLADALGVSMDWLSGRSEEDGV